MEKIKISEQLLLRFRNFLFEDEKSSATVEKYMRDLKIFAEFIKDGVLDKQKLLEYKSKLVKDYMVSSANSMIAALNSFLGFIGHRELCIKRFRVQRDAYCSEKKELTRDEYMRLVETAKKNNNRRLCLILQTICATGIRVSELQYITVDAVMRSEAIVNCKGKNRRIFIVSKLRGKLMNYIKEEKLTGGAIFVTRRGKPMSRNNIWREMKNLCYDADVSPDKVFPHNLRHLFARTFYGIEKDIAKLADILGHTSIDTTRIYIVTSGTEHKRKMETMRLIL